MEREIDLMPRHLLDWLKDERGRGGVRRLEVRATREFVAEDGPAVAEGLDAEDGIAVVTTVGLLEVAPAAGNGHWVLRLRIEDTLASHLPEDGSVPDVPEAIDLAEFESCFLAAGDPEATITLEAGSPAAARSFERVFARILTGRHARRAHPAAGSRMA
jgi:hypothetical protein